MACACALIAGACSADNDIDPVAAAQDIEPIEMDDGGVLIKPPDVLEGEEVDGGGAELPLDQTESAADTASDSESDDAVPAEPSDSGLLPIPPNDFVWFDGTTASTADLVGVPTVLNFWSSNCAACISEMPEFEEVFQSLEGRVAFVGLNRDDTRDAAIRLAESTGISYPLAEDIDSRMFFSFGAFAMPTTVFLNENAEVAYVWQGTLTGEDLLTLIDRHIPPGNL